ncbi:unnamed protein product [Rotaria sp. Silwood1]|nr:unnamed protein product [Rotaria sp. Silwood1]
MLCNTEIKNERRHIILSSVVRVYNNITLPLFILNVDLTDPKNSSRITRIEINEDYHVPIDLLYAYASLPIFIAIDESEEISSHDNIIWISESVDLKVEGKDNYNEHIVIFRNLQQIILIYMNIAINSFGLIKLVTLLLAIVIINKSTIEIEIIETVSNNQQDK